MHVIDSVDADILDTLQRHGRLSNAKLSQQLSLSEPSCWRRLKRLENEGFIEGYQAVLNRHRLGLGLLAFVMLGFGQHDPDATAEMERIISASPHVLACHNVTGEADFLVQVVAKNLEEYSVFVETVLRTLPGVVSVTSNLSLRELKLTQRLPVSASDAR